jgi:hypothetical protein
MVKHLTLTRGVRIDGGLQPLPALLTMRDTDFPTRFFADMGRAPSDRVSTATAADRDGTGAFHLLQPVQRRLNVAMIQLACESVGMPRLDPRRVLNAGVVIRRVPVDASTGATRYDLTPEAWMQDADGRFGWVRLNRTEEDLDPDPSKRSSLSSGQPNLDRMLTAHLGKTALSESFSAAFVAPPEVCDRLNQTIVFAVIPTASSEVSDQPPAAPDYSDGSLKQQIPPLLLAGGHRVPYADQTVDYRYISTDYCNRNGASEFLIFVNLLQVVAIELGAFDGTVAGNALKQVLNRHVVTFADKSTKAVGDFLSDANEVLLQTAGSVPARTQVMPTDWESSSADDEAAILSAAQSCLQQRSASLAAPEGRYQDHTRVYRLRIFLRVQCDAACPPKTLWSDYSDTFNIAPWYESAGMVGPPVPLPRPTKDFLKAARPNVSFVVPDSLMNAMQASTPTSASGGSDSGLSWICGFNIPIITICAFFVLNIFLTLLNIVFFWLPFIKICIPVPASALRKAGGE